MKEKFGLYLILTRPLAGYEVCARAAVDAGVRYLQLRMKGTQRTTVLATGRLLRAITLGTPTRFIVNDDLDVAMEVDADGLHLGQQDLSITEARRIWDTPGKILGLSTHSPEQARQALDAAPDYIGVGPVFPTPTKKDAEPALGVGQTAQIMRDSPLTSVAIGGINTGNIPDLLRAGIRNVCVVRAVNESIDPSTAIHALMQSLKDRSF